MCVKGCVVILSEVVRVHFMEKLASEQRLAVPEGISHVGMRKRILSRGSSLCKGPEAGVFLEKRRRPVWLELGRGDRD